jgi:integrase
MRQKLTPAFVARVTPADIQTEKDATPAEKKPGAHVVYWDTEQRGFGLLVLPSGQKRYIVQYRVAGRSTRLTFKPGLTLTDARKEAKAVLGAVAKGGDPMAERRRQDGAATNTLKAIAEEYFKREGAKLRSADHRLAAFERLIFPVLGAKQIDSIKRSEIVRLLDKIEDERGPSMAHVALAFLSRVFNWHASRDDDFFSPVRRGMGRIRPAEHARERVLTDVELRAVWQAAEATAGPYGHYVRFLLLTATRRNEAADMRRDELSNGDWIIPAKRMSGGKGMKGKREHVVPLSAAAKTIVDGIPTLGPFVFTTGGRHPISSFSYYKRAVDKTSGVTGWRLHDLRRTARSLMSRAGVNADIAERCLAHKIGGVRGTYDRYAYHAEKKRAFEALAAQVERIVNPPTDNVVPLRSGTDGAA